MRDRRFIAEHRGGDLSRENHYKLIKWARECSEHVMPLIEGDPDKRLLHALHVAREWENGNVTTGVAMKASVGAHAAAREYSDPVSTAIARSVGQTVATAHMADHSSGGALYALIAVKHAGRSVEEERDWQIKQLNQLPPEVAKLVLTTFAEKAKRFRL